MAHFLTAPSIFGFSLLYALILFFSILVPMLANEDVFRRYSAKLELEVARKTEMLLNSNKMASLGEMAGGVAHEINTPLAAIQSVSGQIREVLDDDPLDKDVVKEMALSVEERAARIAQIIIGLRAFARDVSADPLLPERVGQLIEDTLALCSERFKEQGVDLVAEPCDSSLTVQCRAAELSQVLLHLLNNARDAVRGSEEKWVEVAVGVQANWIRVSVTDSGPGIRKEVRNKLFQPFFTTKDIGQGTGLGLSSSKGIVEAHGGTLLLNEDHVRTQFVFSLPRAGTRP